MQIRAKMNNSIQIQNAQIERNEPIRCPDEQLPMETR